MLRRVEDAEWEQALAALSRAASEAEVLARCLTVSGQLEHWREHQDVFSGTDAANALDQAAGVLTELAAGRASELLEQVEALQALLPTPWE
jgi:hypothetical protein